jgi:hypothetical protein
MSKEAGKLIMEYPDSSVEFVVAPEPEAEPLTVEPEPISEEVRERVLKEEMERLDSEAAELITKRRTKLKQMKDDPVLRGAVDSACQRMGIQSAAAEALGVERDSILHEFSRSYVREIRYMTMPKEEGGKGLSLEEAIKEANKPRYAGEEQATLAMFQRLLYDDPEHIWWDSLRDLFFREPRFAEEIWKKLKQGQRKELESGHRCAKIFEKHKEFVMPAARAEFIAVHESFCEQYKPQGGIDYAMIDMLAVTYTLWLKWTREVVLRSETEARYESHDYRQWREKNMKRYFREGEKVEHKYSGQWLDGAWDLPYQHQAEALAQAVETADRYRRAFQSQIRALRDWRRYSVPVTINNPQQVNIAADGGQQVNVQNKGRKRTSS